jgi:ATP-dependent helicase HepA
MFCEVKGRERDGFGKLLRAGAKCLAEYFDSSAEGGLAIFQVRKAAVVRKRLGRNTRIDVYRELENRWHVGRVQEDDGEGFYGRFSHKEDNCVPRTDAFVRWKRPIANLSQFLARFVTETPQYAEARSALLQLCTAQRGAPFGARSLLSSPVELRAHRIDLIRRVLNDPSQRYSLVDEVRLGKTRTVAHHIHR